MNKWAAGLLVMAPWLALAQTGVGAVGVTATPMTAPVEVQSTRQPVSTDVLSNQLPRDPADVRAAALAGQALPLNSLSGLTADYKISANDLIEVEVFGVPDLKRTVRVNSSGVVTLALVGRVQLTSLTAQQAEAEIARLYGEKYLQDPQVSVFIKEYTTQRITIEGAVQRPGIYPVTGKLTLLQALALAGGGAAMSNLEEVMLFRPNQSGERDINVYNIDKIRTGTESDPILVAEDLIVVKRNATRALLRDSLFRDVIDSINPFSVLGPK